MNDAAITIDGISKRFGEVQAVNGLSLSIPKNCIFGFLGPNGSGKTTTIRVVLGLIRPDAGSVAIFGQNPVGAGDAVRERCGALLEHDGLYERLSVEDNLELAGRIWRMGAAERTTRTKELLENLGLYERRADLVREWSRGMKRKLAVARAIYHRPSLIFLDEPTSGLDPVAAVELIDDIRQIASSDGVTVFLTTHNLSEAEKLCDEIGIIKKGGLRAHGSMDQIKTAAGEAESLEQAFLRLVGTNGEGGESHVA